MKNADPIIFTILTVSSVLFLVNSILAKSPIVGVIASILYVGSASIMLGKLLYTHENSTFRIVFGVLTLITILALTGTVFIILGQFTEPVSVLTLITLPFAVMVFLYIRNPPKTQTDAPTQTTLDSNSQKTSEKENVKTLVLTLPFALSVILAFRLLWLARTGEGVTSVWLTIPSNFIIVYLIGMLSLALILFFTKLSLGIKLAFICVFSLLSHSLFVLVWYPGRYGDPWSHLGETRYIVKTGMPYAYSWMLQNSLWVDLVKFRALHSIITFFERMLYFDLYWIYVLLVPVLWSIFTPLLAYKIAEILAVKKSRTFPFLAALATVAFSTLVAWGAISVPNSLSFVFFFASVALLLMWIKQGGRQVWLLALLAVAVSFFAHPQPGSFAFMFFFFGTIIKKTSRKILWIAGFLLTFTLYPIALYFHNASFAPAGLFQITNFMVFQSEISTLLLIFALVGVVLGIRSRIVDSKVSLFFLTFYFTILFEYYFTRYGMSNLPYGSVRILAMADFLLVPLVALGFWTLITPLRKTLSQGKKNFSFGLFSRRISLKVNPRALGLVLIVLFLSLQTSAVLYQAYPQSELVKVQPSAYELEAIRFIDSNSLGRYVVLCEPGFASLAVGFLGIDYGYLGGDRGVFGIPEWYYPTMQMYLEMTRTPSIGVMQQAMSFAKATLSYFVVSVRNPDFDKIVDRTSEILPANRVFGNGQLYVFMYPLPVFEESGPNVRVGFDDGVGGQQNVSTRLVYMVESEINATLTLTGHSSYNVSDFPMHWTFLDLKVNNVATPFHASSDVNTFIYVNGLQSSDELTIKWLFNRRYPNVGWKEDSFKSRVWQEGPYVSGLTPAIATDGNVLSISYSFRQNVYQYYYYSTSVGLPTNNTYLLMRWRSDRPVAVAAVYYELGSVQLILPYGSVSPEWSTIIVPLQSNAIVRTVMFGFNNAGKESRLAGLATLEIDYILFSSKPSS